LTSELERIKILEGKISQVIDYINRLTGENEKLRQQIKELRAEKKDIDEQIKKAGKIDADLKRYESEREVLRGKIEAIISQIDQIGI